MPLTDAQRTLLRAASTRHDRLQPRPDRLVGAALTRVESCLTVASLAEPVPVEADQPHWHMDDDDTPIGLRITEAGLAAVGAEAEPPDTTASDDALLPVGHNELARERDEPVRTSATTPRSFRSGSKAAKLVALLSEPEGTSVDALAAALLWRPHTIRAALTRLRQGGFTITAAKDMQNLTVYRIAGTPEAKPADVDAGEIV